MTNSERTSEFVHTGAGTIGGQYLRRFWHPVYESDRLAPGQAVPIRIMGEDFTLYRGEQGTAHVVDFRCPHRGTQLSTGWVEGDEIRCYFHGWKFDPSGQCVEQPAEPKPFCNKIKIGGYPTQEQLGLVFAYFGDGPPPALPRWPEFETPEAVSSMVVLPCNYFQSAENIVDDVHVGFAHRAIPELGQSARGIVPPRIAAEETSYGIKIACTNPEGVEFNHFLMPNMCYIKYCLSLQMPGQREQRLWMQTLFCYVPIDDVSHHHVMVSIGHPLVLDRMRKDKATLHSVAEDIQTVLAGKAEYHKQHIAVARRPDLVRLQDGVTVVGQGAIADRSKDRLGASDASVILLRKIWSRELRALREGGPLTPFERPGELPA